MSNSTAANDPVLASVALYKHGVGAFRWRATIGPEGTLTLPIPANQIDDVLKSLLVLADDGSAVESISYAADEPLQRQLRNFGVDLQDISGLSDLLGRMVGTTVRLQSGNGRVEGQVIATEVVEREVREQVVRDEWLLLLTDQGTIERLELAAMRGLEVVKGETAPRLQAQLDLLLAARQPEISRLHITGVAGQQLDLSYVAETPVWKMTYRIVLAERPEAGLLLQGWAIAENTSATDWRGVELALISGMPLSFMLNLSKPRFRTRPTASIPELETLAPPVAEAELAVSYAMAGPDMPSQRVLSGSRRAAAPMAPMGKDARISERLAAAPPPPTTTRSVGDLFEYRLDHPVTIPAQEAALIPVLAQQIKGSAVSVYNASTHPAHPLNALRIHNTTGLTLDAGPITVLREDSYVGEAMIDVIKPDEVRLVSYAVDLGCRVEAQQRNTAGTIVHMRISQGTATYEMQETATTTYRLTSVTADERLVIIEHPVRPGWDVPSPAPPQTTPSFYRYEVPLPARSGAQLVVNDRHTLFQEYALHTSSVDQIAWFIRQSNNDPAVVEALQGVMAQFRTAAEGEAVVNRLMGDLSELTDDQARLRSNLQALGQGREERDLARRYVEDLTRSEDRLRGLRQAVTDARHEVEQAKRDLQALIDTVELDSPIRGGSS